MKEEWRPVPIDEFKDFYEVSSFGRVRSIEHVQTRYKSNYSQPYTVKGHILAQAFNVGGYKIAHLSVNGYKKCLRVHRLVAMAFIPNPDNLPQINHKDEDKTNNRVDNLEWCSSNYNLSYGSRLERISKSVSKPVVMVSKDGKDLRTFKSIKDAHDNTGASNGNIWAVCNGRRNYAGGYAWRYA